MITIAALLASLKALVSLYKNRKHFNKIINKINRFLNSEYGKYLQLSFVLICVLITVFSGGIVFSAALKTGAHSILAFALGILTTSSFLPAAYLIVKGCIQLSPSKV